MVRHQRTICPACRVQTRGRITSSWLLSSRRTGGGGASCISRSRCRRWKKTAAQDRLRRHEQRISSRHSRRQTERPRGVVTREFTEETGVAIDENEHIQVALMTKQEAEAEAASLQVRLGVYLFEEHETRSNGRSDAKPVHIEVVKKHGSFP